MVHCNLQSQSVCWIFHWSTGSNKKNFKNKSNDWKKLANNLCSIHHRLFEQGVLNFAMGPVTCCVSRKMLVMTVMRVHFRLLGQGRSRPCLGPDYFLLQPKDVWDQCDQIWRFFAAWATFSSLWQQLICPNFSHS